MMKLLYIKKKERTSHLIGSDNDYRKGRGREEKLIIKAAYNEWKAAIDNKQLSFSHSVFVFV